MHRLCPYCKDFDGTKAEVVKLDKPKVEWVPQGEIIYEHTMTHRCKCCGCLYGSGKPKQVSLEDQNA